MNKITILGTTLFLLIYSCNTKENKFVKQNWESNGRGKITWENDNVNLENCYIFSKNTIENDAYEFSFKAKSTKGSSEVQIWSGFGFINRDNRYALGLRGGNSNDIYLSKYQDGANSKLLALESLDFKPLPDKWYKFRIAYWKGNIRVYLNDEDKPRIAVVDKNPLESKGLVLGGGWTENKYKDFQTKNLKKKEIVSLSKDSIQYSTLLSPEEKESLRIKQRKSYKSLKIRKLTPYRDEILLNGDWLFMPEKEVHNLENAIKINSKDENWHVISVPNMWKPVKNWMHGFHRGVSDNFEEIETARCENYTFDYKNSNGGYYRHWIEFTNEIKNKKIILDFSAVAKVAEVWINETKVGKHIGMFGDFKFDISDNIVEGKNLIVVKVNDDISEKKSDGDEIEEIAVTVEVTKDMLNSMAKGMYDKEAVGIWQDVKLIITNPIYINDLFVIPKTNSADFDIAITNKGLKEKILVSTKIFEKDSDNLLFQSEKKELNLKPNQNTNIKISTGKLNPKLWSPENPNLYTAKINIFHNGKIIDELIEDFGFRTIETIGNKFYLNGKPYWLRGANHPPIGIAPNNEKLANKFLKLMHDNNQMITRTHGTTITKAWADAANKQGIGISAEGSWPWVMLGKDMPAMYLLDLWKEEMLSLVKKYRNNPSILLWTISNESYFTNYYHKETSDEIKMKKWKIISELTKSIRKLDPTRPISPTSGYIRYKPNYENVLKPAGIDDGDFDDSHNSYFGWYNPDHFYLFDGKWTKKLYLSTGANPDRPFITQELSSGYPNNDTGHPTRDYIFKHHVPQAWVGDWAYEDHNPAYYLKRNAFLTKEICEVIRRTSPDGAGALHFANICWFRNVHDPNNIESYPVVESMKKALQPILISAELFGHNFYSGRSFDTRVCIINDLENGNSLDKGELKWEINYDNKTLSKGAIKTGKTKHYGRQWNQIKIDLPKIIPASKANCKLKFSLWIKNKKVSENEYDILISKPNWVIANIDTIKKIQLFDPKGSSKKVLHHLGISFSEIFDLNSIKGDLLIVANIDSFENEPKNLKNVIDYAKNGGKVILIHPGKYILSLLPNKIESILNKPGRIVNMHVPESDVFRDISPLELSWWQPSSDKYPTVCKRSYRLKGNYSEEKLCTFVEVHSYLGKNKKERLNDMSGSPLVQFKTEKGIIVASEMDVNIGWKDPISGKLLTNLVEMLTK